MMGENLSMQGVCTGRGTHKFEHACVVSHVSIYS